MTENRKCIYCGRSLEPDMFFCPRCGRPVPADRMEDTKVFSLFEEKNIPSVPVMRTAHLVDTGVFPVIKDEDLIEKKEEPVKEEVREEPVPFMPAEEEERTKPLPAVKEVETEKPEDTKQMPVTEGPEKEEGPLPFITADGEPAGEIDLDAYLKGIPSADVDPDDDLDLSFMETMSLFAAKDAEPAPVREETLKQIVFPVLPEEKEEQPEEPAAEALPETAEEKEPEVASFANSSYAGEKDEGESTGEIDVLGDLQSVLKTLLADEGSDPEEDKLTGARRDSRPSDSTYDVPFVLRRNPVSDEDTKAALKLAGLDQEGREDTRRNDIRPFGYKNEEETIIYPGVFEPDPEKKAVDEGRTVIFQPEEQNFEPIRPAKKAEEEKQPEPEIKEEPKQEEKPKPVSRKEKRREKAAPPAEPAEETKKSALPLYLLIVLLLALIAGLVYFLFFRGNDAPVGPGPVKTAVPAETARPTPEPTAETTAEPTPEATPETTPEPTPTPTPEPVSAVVGKVLVRVEGLNIRSTPGTTGQILGQVKSGTEYEVYADPVTAGGYTWYKISENEERWIADNGNWLTFTKN